MTTEDLINLGLLITPIVLIQLGIAIYALSDLHKRDHVRGQRLVWGLVLILTALAFPSGLIAAGMYLLWGRYEPVPTGSESDSGR